MLVYLRTIFLAGIVLMLLGVPSPSVAEANLPVRHILLLNSYHQSMTWVKDIVQGVEDKLDPDRNNLVIHIENMDSKRFHSEEYFQSLFHFYQQKYQQTDFALLMASDNNAFDFLRQYRDELFPRVPVVFCGVNDFKEEQLEGVSGFTGVEEVFDAAATLQIALHTHPATRKVLIVNDYLKTGRAWEQTIRQQLKPYSDSLDLSYAENLSLAELGAKIGSLESDSIVLLGVYYSDRDGHYITYERIGSLLARTSKVPVYCLLEFNIGAGVIGGNVISGYSQGQTMATLGQKILSGIPPEQIPVVQTGTTKNVFNFGQLQRFDIAESSLPPGSQIINRPFSFYHEYRVFIWLTVGIISLLLLLILFLVITIQRRRIAEKSLRESEQKFRALFDHSYEFIGLMKPDGTLIDANQTAITFSGQDKASLLRRSFWDTAWWQHSSEDRERLREAVKRALTGQTVQFETTHCAADGTLRTIDFSITPLLNDKGQVSLLIPEGRDISERKQMEQKLRDSEDQLKELIEQSPIGLALCTMDGTLVSVNSAYADIIGYSPEETLKLTYWDITPPKYTEEEKKQLKQLEKRGRYGPYEKEYRHKDGQLVPVRLNGMIVVRDDEKFIWSSVEDITALKDAEAEKDELMEQLRQSQKMEAIGTLAGGVAHDFNNILSAILGYTELTLRNPECDEKSRRNLGHVVAAAGRAKDLVRQILMFSRKGNKNREPIRIHEVVLEAIKLLRKTIPSTVSIKLDVDADIGTVLADSTQIHQVVMNLCTNAYHALPEQGGEISVSLKQVDLDAVTAARYPNLRSGKYCRLVIADNGEGMPAEVVERIFEPFFTTKKQGEGTGMGLAVVHGIVQSHHGVIAVESNLAQGSTFVVFLPLAADSVDENRNSTEVEAPVSQPGDERILWIDDEAMLATLGKEILEPLGYSVTTMTSATEALREFESDVQAFDLIVTDQTMPEMTGDMLAKDVLSLRPDIPIIICTGHSAILDAEKAKGIGIKKLLMKPIESQVLIKEVRAVLDAAS